MEIASGQNLWVLPPHFGLWVPAHTVHSIGMPEQVSMRTLYLRPGMVTAWPTCTVFHVRPLLRELIFEVVRMKSIRTGNRLDCAFREVLVAELARATPIPTGVALPSDRRAFAVTESVMNDPARRRSLASLCREEGVSVRTVQRLYRREIGLDFESWRRHVRLMKGIQMLVSGLSIKEVADAVGYEDASTFIALFRATFSKPPKAWVLSLGARSPTIGSGIAAIHDVRETTR